MPALYSTRSPENSTRSRGHPDDAIAARVPRPDVQDAHLELAHHDGQRVLEHHGGPGQPGDRLRAAKQAREAADLARHVLLAALADEAERAPAGDDLLGLVGGGAQHAHRVIVRQHDVLDRLRGHATDAPDHLARHERRGLRVDHHHAVVADDHAGVRIALGGEGVGALREALERDLLRLEIGLGGEGFHLLAF